MFKLCPDSGRAGGGPSLPCVLSLSAPTIQGNQGNHNLRSALIDVESKAMTGDRFRQTVGHLHSVGTAMLNEDPSSV